VAVNTATLSDLGINKSREDRAMPL